MYYRELIRPYKLVNLSIQLQTPTLVRVDINLPFVDGRTSEDAHRMQVYANILELYSDYAGLVVLSHQGRKGDEDFSSLKPHYKLLIKLLPKDCDVEFIPYEKVFTKESQETTKNLRPRQIVLIDNVRYFDHELKFDASTSSYIELFKGIIKTCVNDAVPTWHRDNSSLMCLPYIAQTYVGVRSSFETATIERIMASKESKALISGGKKLQKVSDLTKIYKSGVEGFAGGLIGQLVARAEGHDLGEVNNRFLEKRFDQKEFEDAKLITKFNVQHPLDFTVVENGEAKNIPLEEMCKSKGIIMGIGLGTVEDWATKLQSKEIRIRAGPLEVFEKGFKNGIELTRRIAGDGMVFLGGDTSQEVIESGLDKHITSAGGQILISGGSAIHRLAGGSFPSVDLILEMYKK